MDRDCFTDNSRLKLREQRGLGESNVATGRASAFVKKELVLKPSTTDGLAAEDHKPRGIQPVDFARRSRIGPSLYGVTHALKSIFSNSTSVYFTSGANAEDLGAWFDKRVRDIVGPVAFITADYANFDGTSFLSVGQKAAAGVAILAGIPSGTLHYDYHNRRATVAEFGMRAKYSGANVVLRQVDPTVTSGHDYTTGGNTSVNALVHKLTQRTVYADERWRRTDGVYEPPSDWVQHDDVGSRLRDPAVKEAHAFALLSGKVETATAQRWADAERRVSNIPQDDCPAGAAVMGDDGLVVLPADDARGYLTAFEETSRNFGFIPEARVADGDYDAEFCSSLPWPSADGTVFGPKIGRVISRTGFKRLGDRGAWMGQVRGDALGLAATCNHVPILRAWVAKVLALTSSRKIFNPNDKHKVRAARPHGFTEEAWAFATDRYGLDRGVLEELERQIAGVVAFPVVLTHPAWDVIVRRDS